MKCSDCKHCLAAHYVMNYVYTNEKRKDEYHCMCLNGIVKYGTSVKPTDFCSNFEEKEDKN